MENKTSWLSEVQGWKTVSDPSRAAHGLLFCADDSFLAAYS